MNVFVQRTMEITMDLVLIKYLATHHSNQFTDLSTADDGY
jgi:hypothetical protein